MNINNKYFPNSFDIELAITKGLASNNELNEKFVSLESKYRKYFVKYIYTTLNLNQYDKDIEESSLKYIYIKNNLHIERLCDNDLKLLETCEDANELLNLVKRTYMEIIKITKINGRKTPEKFLLQMFRGYDTRETILPNDALIIVIREGREKNKFNDYQELSRTLKKRFEFIENIKEQLKIEMTKKLDCPFEIVHLII